MANKTIGIFSYPWLSEYSESRKNPINIYRKVVWYKANPRNEEYMKSLFLEKHPDGAFVNVDSESGWETRLESSDAVILLYPDATGLGFRPIENTVMKKVKSRNAVSVLNGRRREFAFDGVAIRQLMLRRFIERAMLGEIAAAIIFIALTPFYAAADFIRGRR